MQTMATIVASLRGGDAASALAGIEPLLAANSADCDLHGLKALALAVSGREDEAISAAMLAVSHAATPAQRLKHAGNLARLLAKTGRVEDLAALTRLELPAAGASPVGAADVGALENLCGPLLMAGEFAFVASYLAPAVDRPDASWELEKIWLKAAAGAGQYEQVLARCEAPSYRWRDRHEAIGIACAAADALGRFDTAGRFRESFIAAAPTYLAPRQASQIMSIVLISPNPPANSLWAPPATQHFISNFPSQVARCRQDRYRFISVFAGSPPRDVRAAVDGPTPVIAVNNSVNGEVLKGGEIEQVKRHQEALGLPLVNPAEAAARCSRVGTAEMLRGIPNLVVPKVMRFRIEAGLVPSLRRAVSDQFALPVILRTVGEQEGRNIFLASSEAEIEAIIANFLRTGEKDFYAIAYAGAPHENGLYRRIRAAYVGGVPNLMRVDYDVQWMVKGRKYSRIQEHYRQEPGLLTLADSFILEPGRIGDTAWQVLGEVGRRMPLDIFGLDFEVDGEGRVVFFEANATMNLLSTAPPEIDYPTESRDEFLARADAFFLARAGVSLQ